MGDRHRVRRLDLSAYPARERAARPRRARRISWWIRRALRDSGALPGWARTAYAGGAGHARAGGQSCRLRRAVGTEITRGTCSGARAAPIHIYTAHPRPMGTPVLT